MEAVEADNFLLYLTTNKKYKFLYKILSLTGGAGFGRGTIQSFRDRSWSRQVINVHYTFKIIYLLLHVTTNNVVGLVSD